MTTPWLSINLSSQEALAAWISMLQVVKYCGVAGSKNLNRRSQANAGGGEIFFVLECVGLAVSPLLHELVDAALVDAVHGLLGVGVAGALGVIFAAPGDCRTRARGCHGQRRPQSFDLFYLP
jgi:hypothetical protein